MGRGMQAQALEGTAVRELGGMLTRVQVVGGMAEKEVSIFMERPMVPFSSRWTWAVEEEKVGNPAMVAPAAARSSWW
jgi:hypothetical protein